MKNVLIILGLAAGLATAPAFADGKQGKEHADKDHCAEMMEHNKAPGGGSGDADKKGCGMIMGKKEGMQKKA